MPRRETQVHDIRGNRKGTIRKSELIATYHFHNADVPLSINFQVSYVRVFSNDLVVEDVVHMQIKYETTRPSFSITGVFPLARKFVGASFEWNEVGHNFKKLAQ